MEKRFKLSVEDVLEKQFNIDFKGYSSGEVDEFLDLVIADYQQYNKMIEELGDHLQEYERQINTLKAKVVELEGKQGLSTNEPNGNNLDILKRLSRLENEVFRRWFIHISDAVADCKIRGKSMLAQAAIACSDCAGWNNKSGQRILTAVFWS